MPVEIVDRGLHGLVLYHRPVGQMAKLAGKDPIPLISAGTRHLVEHQLHWLCDQGFKQIRLSIDDRSRPTEELVGDGARWGCQVSYAYDAQDLNMAARLRKHRAFVGDGMLILEGNAIVQTELPKDLNETTLFTHKGEILPMMFVVLEDWDRLISGAGAFQSVKAVCAWASEHLGCRHLPIEAFAHELDELPDFMKMNREMLRAPESFHFRGLMVEDGVQMGRRASISSQAKIISPVIIGDDSTIKDGTEIGPNVFIGHNAFIERGARISNSVIAPSTYVGQNTLFEGKYVCRNYVLDLESQVGIFIDDPLILADLTRSVGVVELAERVLAALLLVLLFPILMLLLPVHRVMRGSWLITEKILVQPVARNLKSGYDFQWTIWQRFDFGLFMLDFIPSLGDIALGKVKFVGNPPLTKDDVAQLDGIFMGDQLRGKAGLTGPVQQLDSETTSPDEVFATTIYYNATQSIKGDFLLFLQALVPGVHRYKRTVAYGSHHP